MLFRFFLTLLISIFSLALSAQIRTDAPSNSFSHHPSNRNRAHGNRVYDYKLWRGKVYFGFYSYKNFSKGHSRNSMEREFGTVIGVYTCVNDVTNEAIIRENIKRYVGFKYEYEGENGECDRRLTRLDAYNAKFNRHVKIDLTNNFRDLNGERFTLHQNIKSSGIFIRTIFNRSDIYGKPQVHTIKKDNHSHRIFPLSFFQEERPAEAPYYQKVLGTHHVAVVDKGVAAFKMRLDMIKRAKKSIEFLTYIYEPDQAGRIFTQALAQKAKEGVKVRVLIDRAPFDFLMKKKFTTAMMKAGIEVKIHNDNFFKINPWQVRNHQKMLIIDGKEFLTGGRNIANAYFGLHPDKNYLDRDVWVHGPVSKIAKYSFDRFWNDDITEIPRMIEDYDKGFLVENTKDRVVINEVNIIGGDELAEIPVVKTRSATFVGDRPGSNKKYTRIVSHTIYHMLRKNKDKEVIVEAPYFLMMKEGKTLLEEMLGRGVNMSLLTNSRYSVGNHHIPMAYVLEKMNEKNVKMGLDVYAYSGHVMPDEETIAQLEFEAQTELHGKSMVIGNDVFIGTYNLDPRSKYFNVELGVIFENEPELASLMNWSYMRIVMNSFKMDENGEYIDSYLLDEIQERRAMIVDSDWKSLKGTFLLLAKGWL